MKKSQRTRMKRFSCYCILLSFIVAGFAPAHAAKSSTAVTFGGFNAYATGLERGLNIKGIATMNRVPEGKTIVNIKVLGLPSKTTYIVYVHNMTCDDNQGGTRYQNVAGGSTDDTNEIPLGFTTNTAGIGMSHAVVDFITRAEAKSVVVQDADGARLACASLN